MAVDRWFTPLGDGTFGVHLPDSHRQALGSVMGELRELLLADNRDVLRRLYPTAYPDDERLSEEFSGFAHDQLLAARLDALDAVESTLDAESLTDDQLDAWMKSANQLRLVLGTQLDVSEDSTPEYDTDHPLAATYAIYVFLAALVDDAASALTTTLPPPDRGVDDVPDRG